ncbi:hypothetical protein DENSPDRAFT_886475 [Dentipellis sp. KUC8613]|nr:hypothetical protein DENSPDRAFT_886475 [Dentipellis sp. KUC8613]
MPEAVVMEGVNDELAPRASNLEFPLETWTHFREQYLQESLRHEAHVALKHGCVDCMRPDTNPCIRCIDSTFDVLKHFHLVTLQGKLNATDFYHTLELHTDNTGLTVVPDRLPNFMLMVREWRHIKGMKRAGRGHEEGGIAATMSGELAVKCPACPHLGVNIPADGLSYNDPDRDVLMPVWSLDTCYRLKNRLRTTRVPDLCLGSDTAFFVPPIDYSTYVLSHAMQEDISTCAGFAALAKANTKSTKGLRVTGVGAVTCRHEFWLPNGVRDLQRGERYCNMDFIFASTYRHNPNPHGIMTYDIDCQYSPGLWDRVETLPHFLHPVTIPELQFMIPKFHLPAHKEACHYTYSLNYLPGAAQSDGEAVERNWASVNGLASSTKEMTPGARQDTLNDHFGHANWRKNVGIGETILRRMNEAIPETIRNMHVLEEFSNVLELEQPGLVAKWEAEVIAWEKDHKAPCPYELPKNDMTIAATKLKLSGAQADASVGVSPDPAQAEQRAPLSPSDFILLAMDIEESQRAVLADDAKDLTPTQVSKLRDRCINLAQKIQRFSVQEALLCPTLHGLGLGTHMDRDAPEKVQLVLPSSSTRSVRKNSYPVEVVTAEMELCYAEATEALDRLRHHLRIATFVNRYKTKNVKGQVPNTRAWAVIHQVNVKVWAAFRRYCHARECHLSLAGEGEWMEILQLLERADIHGLSDRNLRAQEKQDNEGPDVEFLVAGHSGRHSKGLQKGESEGRRSLSWIWYGTGLSGGSSAMHTVLSIDIPTTVCRIDILNFFAASGNGLP